MRQNRLKRKKKYESSSGSSSSEYESEDSDQEEEEVEFSGKLDDVVLTAAEEEAFQEKAAEYKHDYHVDIEEVGVSDQSERSEQSATGPSDENTELYSPVPRICKIAIDFPSHEKLLTFLLTSNRNELIATNEWNRSAKDVYSLFNVSKCIVHPDYFFTSEMFPDIKISKILAEMEKSKDFLSWSCLKPHLKHFLRGFEGFEKLSDVFHEEQLATPLITQFYRRIHFAEDSESINPKPGWYWKFMTFTMSLLNLNKPGNCSKSTFHEYIAALFNLLNVIAQGHFPLRNEDIKLVLPKQKSSKEITLEVKPDFMLLKNVSIMLVGKVKGFGHCGVGHVAHKGHRVRTVQPDVSNLGPTPQTKKPDTEQPPGQGDQLPPTVNEKDKSFPSVTTDEPHASISNEQTENSTNSEQPPIPLRSLDAKERFKTDAYLPQLFGQMLAAMQFNEDPKLANWYFRFCTQYERVQFGFAVEGFKLRFVKLTMIDLKKKETPTVSELLRGKPFKCSISMTQEFNLLQKHHLKMFYQVLVAMNYLCRH